MFAFNRSLVLSNAFGCPVSSGKNREAGENPARSRHCEDRRFGKRRCKARRPARTLFAAYERLAQGCSGRRGDFSSQKRSRRQPVAFAWQKGRRDFVFSISQKLHWQKHFSAPPLRPLRLCGERSSNKTHRRDAEDAEGAQRENSTLVHSHYPDGRWAESFVLQSDSPLFARHRNTRSHR